MPPPGSKLTPPTFDLESDVRVTYVVGYLCANFGLLRPLYQSINRIFQA